MKCDSIKRWENYKNRVEGIQPVCWKASFHFDEFEDFWRVNGVLLGVGNDVDGSDLNQHHRSAAATAQHLLIRMQTDTDPLFINEYKYSSK